MAAPGKGDGGKGVILSMLVVRRCHFFKCFKGAYQVSMVKKFLFHLLVRNSKFLLHYN